MFMSMSAHAETSSLRLFSHVWPNWPGMNNKMHFSLAITLKIAQVLTEKMVKNHRFCSFTNNKKLPTIPPGLAGKIAKNCPLSEPIRLQDLEDSVRSQAQKKINIDIFLICFLKFAAGSQFPKGRGHKRQHKRKAASFYH